MVVVVVAVLTGSRGRCTKRLVRNARKNVKFLSSPEETVRYTARTVSQSARTAVVKRRGLVNLCSWQ
jgi:hypothetical protein